MCPNTGLPDMRAALERCVKLKHSVDADRTNASSLPIKFSSSTRIVAWNPCCFSQSDFPTILHQNSEISTNPGSTVSSSECINQSLDEGLSHSGSAERGCLPLKIDWLSFMKAEEESLPPCEHPRPDVSSVLPNSNGNQSLFSLPYNGMRDLWTLLAKQMDPILVEGFESDPSGLVPLDVLSLQACCKIFQLLAVEIEKVLEEQKCSQRVQQAGNDA